MTHRTSLHVVFLMSACLITACSAVADFSRFGIEDAGMPLDAAPSDAEVDAGCGASCTSDIEALVAGELHHCALVAGDVYCWGSNDRYQVSPRDELYFDAPTLVALPGRATQISGRDARSCAVLEDATAVCWGEHASLFGVTEDLVRPTDVGVLDVAQIETGCRHACVRSASGDIRCWGANDHGQIGTGSTDPGRVEMPTSIDVGGPVRSLALGCHTTCVLLMDDTVMCWGNNARREAGGDDSTDFTGPGQRIRDVAGDVLRDVSGVSCGSRACCATVDDAARRGVYCWGENETSLLGPTVERSVLSTRHDSGRALLALSGSISAVSLELSACAIDSGSVFCWGSSDKGRLGDGVFAVDSVLASPQTVAGVSLDNVEHVAMGRDRACVASGSAIECWGTVTFRTGTPPVGTEMVERTEAAPTPLPLPE